MRRLRVAVVAALVDAGLGDGFLRVGGVFVLERCLRAWRDLVGTPTLRGRQFSCVTPRCQCGPKASVTTVRISIGAHNTHSQTG